MRTGVRPGTDCGSHLGYCPVRIMTLLGPWPSGLSWFSLNDGEASYRVTKRRPCSGLAHNTHTKSNWGFSSHITPCRLRAAGSGVAQTRANPQIIGGLLREMFSIGTPKCFRFCFLGYLGRRQGLFGLLQPAMCSGEQS